MNTGELILLLLLVLVAAVVVALVLRRSSAGRAEQQRVEASHPGSQAEWLEAAEAPAAAPVGEQPADAVPHPSEDADADADVAPATRAATPDESEDLPMTRAERRQAREEAEAAVNRDLDATSSEPDAASEAAPEADPVVVAAGATTEASAWTSPADAPDPESERIAAAADYRDEVAEGGSPDEVHPSVTAGGGEGMNDAAGTTATDPASEDALSQDVEIPTNEWGGPREDATDPTGSADASKASELAIIADPEEFAATEPVLLEEQAAPDVEERVGRRISGFLELRDGGFGVGSAAPFDDGAQPLDHPVQAYRDTMTFRAPGDAGYDSAEPDVWFYDAGAAERSGFSRSEG